MSAFARPARLPAANGIEDWNLAWVLHDAQRFWPISKEACVCGNTLAASSGQYDERRGGSHEGLFTAFLPA